MNKELLQRKAGEKVPFPQRVLGSLAHVFFRYPELFAISSEPLLDRIPVGIYMSDVIGHIYYANPELIHMLGYEDPREFKQKIQNGGGLNSLYGNPQARDVWTQQMEAQGRKKIVSEQRLKRKDGQIITVRDTSVRVGEDYRHQPIYFGVVQDISEEVKMREQLEKEVITDSVTGLLNRNGYNLFIQREIDRSIREEKPLSTIMFDIDHFKQVNDEYGHRIGDDVLRTVAVEIKKILRKMDIFARWGGDEFIIILPETVADGAFILAEKIRKIISELCIPLREGGDLTNTISLGVTEWTQGMSIEELEERVDTALYVAKEGGRNKSVIYTEGMEKRKQEDVIQ